MPRQGAGSIRYLFNRLGLLGAVWAVSAVVWAGQLQATVGSGESSPQLSNSEHLVILHLNDTHGRLGPQTLKGKSVGGIARMAGLVKQIRKDHPQRVLLLHAGDVFSRGDKVTRYWRGQANIDLMSRVGFDAMVLGNGEYYFGLENLRQRISEAKFTVLGGNIFETTGKKPKAVGKNYVIKKVGPLRVGLMGLSLIRAEDPSAKNLRTGDNLKLARKWLRELVPKTDLVVLLSHQGFGADTMLAGTLSGVNIIVGGHTHTVLSEPVIIRKPNGRPEKVYLVQAGEYYEHLGRIDLAFERRKDGSWHLVKVSSRLIPINASVEADAAIAARLDEYRRALRAKGGSTELPNSKPVPKEIRSEVEELAEPAEPAPAAVSP